MLLDLRIRKKQKDRSSSKKIPLGKQITFFHRMAALLGKGYPLVDALKMTSWDHSLKPITVSLIQHLTQGDPIDVAFQKVNFTKSAVNFLYFGRIHHDLPSLFQQCEDLLLLQKQYTSKLKQVLRYPLLLLCFLVIAFTIIKQKVLPNFITLFQTNDSKPITFILIQFINYLINGMGLIIVASLVLYVLWKVIKPKLTVEQCLTLYQKVNIWRWVKTYSFTFLLATHLSSLLAAGLTLQAALEMIKSQTKYTELSHYCNLILSSLSEGVTLGQAIHQCPLLKEELTSIFHQVNDLQALSQELTVLSEFLMEQIQDKIMNLIQLVQPVFFIIIAVIIVTIYAAIMLPLYEWMGQI